MVVLVLVAQEFDRCWDRRLTYLGHAPSRVLGLRLFHARLDLVRQMVGGMVIALHTVVSTR